MKVVGAVGKARIRRSSHGWRVTVLMHDAEDRHRVYVAHHDTWLDALDHAVELASIGRP